MEAKKRIPRELMRCLRIMVPPDFFLSKRRTTPAGKLDSDSVALHQNVLRAKSHFLPALQPLPMLVPAI